MNVSDVVFEMELSGVDTAVIADIVEICESKGFNGDFIDEELTRRGYPKIFNINYDDYDDYDSFNEEEFYSVEKFPHKRKYN